MTTRSGNGHELDMDLICTLIHAAGLPAYVEQTGGGCATIQAGPTRLNGNGDSIYAALCGPGWFESFDLNQAPPFQRGRAHTDDCYVGADDQGDTEAWAAGDSDDEQSVAERIITTIMAAIVESPDWVYPAHASDTTTP